MRINKVIKVVGIAIIGCSLMSCASKKEEEKIIKAKTSIKGDLGKYFEVVDKQYKFIGEDEKKLMIEVKRNDIPFDFSTEKLIEFRGDYGTFEGEDSSVGIGFELFDENGPIYTQMALENAYYGPNNTGEVISLMKLKSGETGYITINAAGLEDPNTNVEDYTIYKKTISFQLTSGYTTVVHGKNKNENNSDDDLSNALDAAAEAVKVMGDAAEVAKKISEIE
jgi:hypothetical protein